MISWVTRLSMEIHCNHFVLCQGDVCFAVQLIPGRRDCVRCSGRNGERWADVLYDDGNWERSFLHPWWHHTWFEVDAIGPTGSGARKVQWTILILGKTCVYALPSDMLVLCIS